MRAHYLQHVPFEGLGSIQAWFERSGYDISGTQFYDTAVLPEVDDIDFLVVLGGPMSVNDETDYPWLVKEKDFIIRSIQSGIPVLGICLGAQLIVNALGSDVFPNTVKEIGWFPIQPVYSEGDSVFRFPDGIDVFHWHGETFDLPDGAIRIAESKACKNQAFQIASQVIGLQFHLETTPASAKAIIDNCRNELVDEAYIQSESEILSAPQKRYASINELMGCILQHLVNNRSNKLRE